MRVDEQATDQHLLGCYLNERNEEAFVTLVRRHGNMIWGVCRRILGNVPDAEDAFQAVFLVLVAKARSLRHQVQLGPWLYGVAYTTALKQRANRSRRQQRERAVLRRETTAAPDPEFGAIVDQEIHRLPEKYQQALILCALEGVSRQTAAERLGIPAGTLSSRLASAKEMLATRLTRRGITLSAVTIVAALQSTGAHAQPPAACVSATLDYAFSATTGSLGTVVPGSVAALSREVLRTMLIHQCKRVALLLLSVGVCMVGVVWLALIAMAAGGDLRPDAEHILGEWKVVSVMDGGREVDGKTHRFVFSKTAVTMIRGDKKKEDPYRLDPTKNPKWLDINHAGGVTSYGIYKFEGKGLTICVNERPNGERPTKFESERGSPNDLLIVLERIDKKK